MPHGVVPPAQLPKVPRMRRPVGSAAVRSSSWPAAGPATVNGVWAVIRRLCSALRWSARTQEPFARPRSIVTTAMPCAAIAMRLIVASS